jgi:hypothetical protein
MTKEECPFCHEEVEHVLRHVADCVHAPEEARSQAAEVVAKRDAYAKSPVACCKMRKKVLVQMSVFPESDCGIHDSEMADFMTFDQFLGKPSVAFKFCPWCGKPWVLTGINVL